MYLRMHISYIPVNFDNLKLNNMILLFKNNKIKKKINSELNIRL